MCVCVWATQARHTAQFGFALWVLTTASQSPCVACLVVVFFFCGCICVIGGATRTRRGGVRLECSTAALLWADVQDGVGRAWSRRDAQGISSMRRRNACWRLQQAAPLPVFTLHTPEVGGGEERIGRSVPCMHRTSGTSPQPSRCEARRWRDGKAAALRRDGVRRVRLLSISCLGRRRTRGTEEPRWQWWSSRARRTYRTSASLSRRVVLCPACSRAFLLWVDSVLFVLFTFGGSLPFPRVKETERQKAGGGGGGGCNGADRQSASGPWCGRARKRRTSG